jgi:hypothetical protein
VGSSYALSCAVKVPLEPCQQRMAAPSVPVAIFQWFAWLSTLDHARHQPAGVDSLIDEAVLPRAVSPRDNGSPPTQPPQQHHPNAPPTLPIDNVAVSPFEHILIDVALEAVCRSLRTDAAVLQTEVYPVVDWLTHEVTRESLMAVRALKNRHQSLTARVRIVRDQLEQLTGATCVTCRTGL